VAERGVGGVVGVVERGNGAGVGDGLGGEVVEWCAGEFFELFLS